MSELERELIRPSQLVELRRIQRERDEGVQMKKRGLATKQSLGVSDYQIWVRLPSLSRFSRFDTNKDIGLDSKSDIVVLLSIII